VLREVASGGRDAERVKLKLEIVVEVIYHLSVCVWSFCQLVFTCRIESHHPRLSRVPTLSTSLVAFGKKVTERA
jgi:hypothetical protein